MLLLFGKRCGRWSDFVIEKRKKRNLVGRRRRHARSRMRFGKKRLCDFW
jgi:hypothetical protein